MNDKPEEEKAQPIKLDTDEINSLLDVVLNTKDLPSLIALNQAAMTNLTIINREVQEELEERAEALRKKGEEEAAKKAKEAADKRKAEEAKEKTYA